MARDVDKKKTRKALRKLKRVAERAQSGDAADLNEWEQEFVDGVKERLETYGSAFRDPAKGPLDEALSQRQTHIVRVLDKKTRPKSEKAKALADRKPLKAKSGFKRKAPVSKSRVRDIHDDVVEDDSSAEAVEQVEKPSVLATPEERRAAMRIVRGGADD